MEYKNKTHKIYTVQTVLRNKPFYRGGVEPPNKFAKRGGLNRIFTKQGFTKIQYIGENCLKRGLGQFAKRGLAGKEGGGAFEGGGLIPQCILCSLCSNFKTFKLWMGDIKVTETVCTARGFAITLEVTGKA